MSLALLLDNAAQQYADATALIMGDRRMTFDELRREADRFAFALLMRGLAPGQRVGVCLPNVPEAVVAIWGILKAGGAFVMVNPTTKAKKLDHILRHSDAQFLVTNNTKDPAFVNLPNLQASFLVGPPDPRFFRFDEATSKQPLPVVGGTDLAAILYTSGSTGAPKGVSLSHQNIETVATAIVQYLSLSDKDVLFNALPLSFGYGLTQLFSACAVGATFVCERDMTSPHATLTRLAEVKATGFAIVPPMAAMMLECDLPSYDLSHLRYITNAGAHLPQDLGLRLADTLPATAIVCMYGQTECLRISYLSPSDFRAHPESVGKGMPYQELFLVDDRGNEVTGEQTGELVVCGDHVMLGYWDDDEATAKKLRPPPASLANRIGTNERLLFTGDLFRRDAEGFLYFISRKDDIIKSRGEKVSPAEVERVLLTLSGVKQVAVFGVEKPRFGTVIKAVIVPERDAVLIAREVIRFCTSRLEDYMVPTIIEFREELPMTDRGKVDKAALR